MKKYFNKICKTKSISSWKSEELSDEVIKPPAVDNNIRMNVCKI